MIRIMMSAKKKKKNIEAGIVSEDLKEKMVKSSKQKGKLCIEMQKERRGGRKEEEELFNLINVLELKSKILKQICFIINGPNNRQVFILQRVGELEDR